MFNDPSVRTAAAFPIGQCSGHGRPAIEPVQHQPPPGPLHNSPRPEQADFGCDVVGEFVANLAATMRADAPIGDKEMRIWIELMPARMAARRDYRTCPTGQGPLPGQGVTGARERPLSLARQAPVPVPKKGLDEVTADQPDRDEENVIEMDAMLVEEVSIDGMCGVY